MAFTFVDLFAGIGGFHAALRGLGGECVFASEIDPAARSVYEHNWGTRVAGDIVPLTEPAVLVPEHDVLCAGFPCQPFSKSGKQLGMRESRGELFWSIERVMRARRPSLVILENVKNLVGPRHRGDWNLIIETMRSLGYAVSSTPAIVSPHWIPPAHDSPPWLPAGTVGTPQNRERVFIVGVHVGEERARAMSDVPPVVPKGPVGAWDPHRWNLEAHLPLTDDRLVKNLSAFQLTETERGWIRVWDDFLARLDYLEKLPGFPIWAEAFESDLRIPVGTPSWKQTFLEKNAAFYRQNRRALDSWLKKHGQLEGLPPSRRKFEWQAQDERRELSQCILHFRPSGIRVKRGTYTPALVAMNQGSIIGSRGRRLTTEEAARLQGLDGDFEFGNQPDALSYRQLGNGVSVGAVRYVFHGAIAMFRSELPPHLASASDVVSLGAFRQLSMAA